MQTKLSVKQSTDSNSLVGNRKIWQYQPSFLTDTQGVEELSKIAHYYKTRPLTFILDCRTLRLGKPTSWTHLPNKAYVRDVVRLCATLPPGGILVLCKSRQMSISWIASCYVAWCLVTKKNWHAIWASIKQKQAQDIITKRISKILDFHPYLGVKPFYRQLGNAIIVPYLGNSVTAVARGATQVTGDAYNLLVLDEFAKIEPAYLQDRVYKEVLPALEIGQTFIISTPVGGTLFQDLYEEE